MFDPLSQYVSLYKCDSRFQSVISIMAERSSPRASYTASFKLRVVAYAVDNGNRAAGKQSNVDESCVRRWRSQREKLLKTPRNKRALRGHSAGYLELEKEVAEWITEKRKAGTAMSTNICLKAKSVAQKLGLEQFKMSKCWCYRFMDRFGFSIRRRTTIAQKLPQDYEEKLIKFQRYMLAKRKEHDFDLKCIGNADQTPLTFDIETNCTVSEKGVKSVPILSTGHDKDRFTVMLACLGDGTKLSPYVVFKRKTLPKNVNFRKEVVVRCQAKGWMDETLVQDWLRTVWSKVGGLSRRKSMLVWDSFQAHLSKPVRSTLRSINTECMVIPGGMTSMLQPLDVSINKPFKDGMRAKLQNWMLAGQHSFTAGDRICKVELDEIGRWISDAWDDIPTEMIAKLFRKCCITNTLDGTEDEEIWEEESDSDPFEDLDEITSDDQLYYADNFEQQQAEIEPECFENIFGESDSEDFYGFQLLNYQLNIEH